MRLKQSIRHSDTIARIGGDEFVLLLENTFDKDAVSSMAENLSKALDKAFIINDEEFKISCSIGVAIYPDEGTTTDTLLAVADKAMYKAKHKQRDTD